MLCYNYFCLKNILQSYIKLNNFLGYLFDTYIFIIKIKLYLCLINLYIYKCDF